MKKETKEPKVKITRKVQYISQNSKKKLKEESTIAKAEKKDCVVYATAAAFDIDYDTAHGIVKERFKREDKKGTKNGHLLKGMEEMVQTQDTINGKVVSEILAMPKKNYKCYGEVVPRSLRVYSFAEQHKEGTYLILVREHALVVKDGVIIDNNPKVAAKSLVQHVFKVTEKEVK